ncbi:MAG: DinB family protein [Deltaproteobacteria bacterium]|jgi:hypothetical protein|nr:DinB family protein [Deltaproteobacteria bacterium]
MSRETVDSLAAGAFDALGLLKSLIDQLPDNLWTEPIGTWPVWQHIVHALWGNDFFTPGPAVPAPEGLSIEVLRLMDKGTNAPTKAQISAYLADVRTKIENFAKGVSDSDLNQPNEKAKSIGLDWNLTRTFAILVSHPYYHIGYGDALMRNNGLSGVF